MKLKKIFSIIMAFVLLVGIVLPCVPVLGAGETEHEHTYGQWSFDAENGTQSRVCSSCDDTQVLYGTTNKVSQAEDPKVGESYYLAANVKGSVKYFTFEGKVTVTLPYSLNVTDDLSNGNIKKLTLEDPTLANEGTATGFQLIFDDNGTTRRIYCYNVETSNGAMDTGINTANYKGRHTFMCDEVNGVKVLRKLSNNNILVVKYFESIGSYRMLGVPESELANEGVYPAMLVTNHTHTYADEYEFDNTSHWRSCDCGDKAKESHNFVDDPSLGYGVCVCGANLAPHDCVSADGKWYPDGDKHYQLCGQCNAHINIQDHSFDSWAVDAEKGTQGKICSACQAVGKLFHGTTEKVEQVTQPVIGSSYYLVANVGGTLLSFLSTGGYTETTPYSLRTTEVLGEVNLHAALQDGKGEFQMVDPTGKYIYSVSAGAGATVSSGYITKPDRVSFLMDEVNGVPVIRAYGTGNILAVKYSQAKSAWRMWCLPEEELANEGVYPVMLATKHEHTFGTEWVFDAENGTQSRLCTECGLPGETFYGTDMKVSQVTEPAIGSSYHLAANAKGQLIFFRHGQATDTTPYSLVATDDFNHNWVLPVTIEDPTLANEGTAVGFQLTYTNPSNGALTRIYCYDVLKDSATVTGQTGVMDTGTNTVNYKGRHTFMIDKVGGVSVLRKLSNDNILVAKYNEAKAQWRILGVPESELANEGVYPVMLVDIHQHSFGNEYEKDVKQHWHLCSECGSKADVADHEYEINAAGDRVCVCGYTLAAHECQSADGKWFYEGDKHYQLCGICNEKIKIADHTYGDWNVDTQKGTQTQYCTVCQAAGQTIHGTTTKMLQEAAPEIGSSYYLVANVGGQILSFESNGGYTETSPYSLRTTTTLSMVTLQAALQAGAGEFQMVDATGKYIYSVSAGAGATVSGNYVNDPSRVSFLMDEVNGVPVIRAYGTDNILVVKYSEAKSAWRMWCLPETELANEDVYPVMLATKHEHTYGEEWVTDAENGTQSHLCTVCGLPGETLYGTGIKGYQVSDPELGKDYYLAANAKGKLIFFRHGTATDTVPYSLVATDNFNHKWVTKVTIEDPTLANEGTEVGFQLTYTNPSSGALTRIYCYDVLKDSDTVTGQTGVMDTGLNTTNYRGRHTFMIDEVNGVTVLRKLSNRNILVVKYNEAKGEWRMLGVPESELGQPGVYPAMLMTLHEHTHTDNTYLKDETGHWFACDSCGGQSDFAEHTVAKWTYTVEPTQTTAGTKTGTCTVCGGTAVVQIPPMVAEGCYYLTGILDGKTYYFRDKASGESVEHTVPFSLMATDNEKKAQKVDIKWDEKENTYILSYTVTRTLNIYMGDVAGSIITEKDGFVDLSSSATTNEALILYKWDPAAKRFYQMEGNVRYVIAFKKMTLTDGSQAVRMLAVPETELGGDVAAMQLQVVHIHQLGDAWNGDALNHWKECSCGERKNEGAHTVAQWTVEKEPTAYEAGRKSGICSGCGLKVVNAIPMLTDNITAPVNGGKYYLTAVLGGVRYYFCHTPSGGSVADTYPYSLYTDPGDGKVTPVRVKVSDGNYKLYYGEKDYHIYVTADGVGITTKQDSNLVDFQWDAENKVLYQMEGDVKQVLVLKKLRTNSGAQMLRITAMPLDQALIDPNVSIIRFTTNAPVKDEKGATGGVPEDATLLKNADSLGAEGDLLAAQTIDPNKIGPKEDDQGTGKWLIAVLIAALAIPAIILLLAVLKHFAWGIPFFTKRNLWAGFSLIAAGILLVVAMILPMQDTEAVPGLEAFTIVANDGSMENAKALAVEIYEDYGISLPVVHCDNFAGDYGIYLNVNGFNSYGGYKYSISASSNEETGTGIYIDGTGYSLENAISKWTKSLRKAKAFPFGVTETVVGYEWNTGDVNMTGLGFTLKEQNVRQLYEGVQLRELKYDSFAYGKNTGYAVIIDSDAPVELKVSAGQWDENTTTENPGTKHTVQKHAKLLADAGYEVLAITNAGFYDLNTTMTYIPWGMQIVDGLVKKEPNKDNPKNTDNWFAQTADGKYVISNTDGYYETYETTLSDGVGGGLLLMKDGKPCFTGTTPDFRTVVGITTDGDLVMLTISGANYAVVVQAFMDMGLDMECILNLDGGGSTTLHTLDENGKLKQFICETPIEREVADAIAIVKKK